VTVLRSGAATDVGLVRASNQDMALADSDLFAVADGMGGHVGGEIAARTAIETLRSEFSRSPSTEGLLQAVVAANGAIWDQSQSQHELHGMGTTVTAMGLVEESGSEVLALANVGDSRAYLYSQDELRQITLDHSLAEEKYRLGELTQEQAETHPSRHILTRALGVSPNVRVDLWRLGLRAGDRVLLCSDGLSNEVAADQIHSVLDEEGDPQRAADQLVELARAHGGSDNITVVVVDVVEGESGDGSTPVTSLQLPATVSGVAEMAGDATAAGMSAAGAAALGASGEDPVTGVVPQVPGNGSPTAQRLRPVAATRLQRRPEPLVAPGRPQEPPDKESRRARRRRLGIPRPITLRVLLFFLLVAGVFVAGYYFIRWYGTSNYYVTSNKQGELVIYQGRPGGVLWVHPKLVQHSGITTAQIPATAATAVHGDVQEPTLAAARRYIFNLHQEFLLQQAGTAPQSNPGLGPSGTLGTIPPPPTEPSTTLGPGETTPSTPPAQGAP
jgi:protein phosphatase